MLLGRYPVLTLVLLAGALVVPGLAPTATAHCPDEADSGIVAGVSTCPYNGDVEAAVDALNEASGDETVYVLVKELGFHPQVVDVADGGTIVFVWGDIESQEQHDPKSSGIGDDPDCRMAHQDPAECRPHNPGACFELSASSNFLSEPGDTYEVTFRVTEDGTVQVSESPLAGDPIVGEPPFADRFRDCPEGTAEPGSDGTYVLPYHCGIHGGSNTTETIMRAAAVLHA